MKAVQLLGVTGVAVKLGVKEFKTIKIDDFNNIRGHIFPSQEIIIVSLTQYGKGTLYLTYVYEKEIGYIRGAYIPEDFKMTRLRSKKSKGMIELYEKSMLDNLPNHIGNKNFNVGSDPEIFVEDGNGEMIPAFNFLGSKEKPNKGTRTSYYGGNDIYWDGFQAEFTTAAGTCLSYHVDSVQAGLQNLLSLAKKHDKSARLSIKTTMDIPPDLLINGKEEHVSFGCMPSFNVYGMKGIQGNGRDVPFRSAGGHIHFGIGPKDQKVVDNIVKALDAILGVACVSLFAKYDNPKRRTMYGLAGEYRLPKHGLEYRVLSNAWLSHPLIMNMVFDIARKALMIGEKGLLKFWNGNEKETIEVINNCDVAKAREILVRNKDFFLKIIEACYHDKRLSQTVYDIFMDGMESVILNPSDFEKNWNLDGSWTTHSDGIGKGVAKSRDILSVKGNKVA